MTDSADNGQPTTTWRDLADQLTPRQIAELEELESLHRGDVEHHGADPEAYRIWMIGEAREFIANNQRDAELNARIQPPTGSRPVDGWDSISNTTGLLSRPVQWFIHELGRTAVAIDGWQDETGAVDGPHLSVYGFEDGKPIEASEARMLAASLTTAARELEALERNPAS